MVTREEAKRIVEKVGKQQGYISETRWRRIQEWDQESFEDVRESMHNMRKVASQSIKALASNIYGSNARFFFELLQNADDNCFTRAKTHGSQPFFNFDLRPDHIIVDCNEDGFEKKNLEAICTVGDSSKTTSHGYIGNKGIGFKSVFMVARKINIESGPYSFRFEIESRSDGLGMITPIWTDLPAPESNRSGTRMTLYLHPDGNEQFNHDSRSTIVEQLESLDPTCLLFLKNLKQMNITIWDVDGKTNRSKTFHLDEVPNGVVRLKATTASSQGATQESLKHYRKISRTFTGLPVNVWRFNKNLEAASTENRSNKDWKTAMEKLEQSAEVVLAFPLTEDGMPLEQRQQLFAFLPMSKSDYDFIIHTDFVTNASREHIVTSSPRNQALRVHIATTFVDAIKQFCDEDSALRYRWPAFLPAKEDTHDQFWKVLNDEIERQISQSTVLVSRNKQQLRTIDQVFEVADDFIEEDGTPLLDDPITDPFLSPSYPSSALQSLQEYGLEPSTFELAVDLIRKDLNSFHKSKIRDQSTSEDWHSRLARLVVKDEDTIDALKSIAVIPLRSGDWACVADGPVFFPSTKGFAIPAGLPLQMIDPTVLANTARKAFFTRLGVEEPQVNQVRAAIVSAYAGQDPSQPGVSKETSLAHLHYLYQTRQTASTSATDSERKLDDLRTLMDRLELRQIFVHAKSKSIVFPHQTDVYLPGRRPFGAELFLLAANLNVPGFDLQILDPVYLQHPPSTSGSISWSTWLCNDLGIRESLRLVDHSGKSLSSVWNYMAEHMPSNLLPVFQHRWNDVKSTFIDSEVLRTQVKNTSARELCRCVQPPACKLQETFLPTPALLETFKRFAYYDQAFPFLRVEAAESSDWDFLVHHFSVRRTCDLDFLLAILSWIKKGNPAVLNEEKQQRLLKLYVAIRAQCVSDGYRADTKLRIRTEIEEGQLLYIPASGSRSFHWSTPSRCRLEGPAGMLTKDSIFLDAVPSDVPKGDLTAFYKDILGISSASMNDLLDELSALHQFDVDFDHVLDVYRRLDKMTKGKSEGYLNQQFELHQMIFIDRQQRRWYKPSECLWTSTTKISGKIVLSDQNDHYKDLRDFFIKSVGVRLLTLRMVYDELIHSSNGKSADELKSTIRSLNALLLTDNESLDPKPLLQQPIFAVRHGNGSSEKVSVATDFAIPDREDLASHFKNKVTMLAYSLEEIVRLRPFLEWAGLTTRYLSVSVKENTSVVDGGAREILRSDRDLKRKAHALLRIAATFNSPRWQTDQSALYEAFHKTKVLETDAISSLLTLRQNGQTFEVVLNAGDMHIDDKQNNLDIYVPRSRKAQDICFNSALPKNLASWLMQHPRTHVMEPVDNELIIVLTSCLSNSRSVVDSLLERHRIIQISVPNEDGESGDEDAAGEGNPGVNGRNETMGRDNPESELTDTLATLSLEENIYNVTPRRSFGNSDDSNSSPIAPSNAERTLSRDSELSSDTDTVTSRAVSSFQSRSSLQPSLHRPFVFGPSGRSADVQGRASGAPGSASPFAFQFATDGEDRGYRKMLERVVDCERRAAFPYIEVLALTSSANALQGNFPLEQYDGLDNTSVFRSESQLERNRKVGAAGELYVYELLSNLSRPLQGWSRDNWKSKIRDKVNCHADYYDLEAWTGSETADLVYKDTHGDLTDLLCDKGYLDHIHEEQRRITGIEYLIEVKTTTGAYDTPFYMSGGQYQLMQNAYSVNSARRYMVARVFNVNSSNIGMKVYVNPERLRLSGDLVFSERTYSVVPRPS
ncbi:hypothetical protein M409DRAFT_17255 [Zasmidium cellare ATCC 36951]|uniref:Uncharacterized protein n=1 Tax=Zasmidium cellare ATCC 36951 TaxID=1080233 RepID=A0A6A6D1K9_ZASCE|nr:uncharacterized protein M409DRAFT_17255 [Zasmidium cellare ATCC 36951]KAF2173314.1 hypothetical protein M409DRAFT_17255 [Zasmidium cellare ATCC 36951]